MYKCKRNDKKKQNDYIFYLFATGRKEGRGDGERMRA